MLPAIARPGERIMRIAVVATGEMGGGIAARLKARGAEVFTSLAGRSEASRVRARAAGITVIDDDAALIANVEIFLSVVPPDRARALAERFAPGLARAGGKILYADCNAVAPETVRAIAKIVAAAGAPFADAGIIGGPPKGDDAGPRLYASGEGAARLAELTRFGLDIRPMEGGIGAASALKLSYAALTKGLTALGVAAGQGAAAAGVTDALAAELASSQPALFAFLVRGVPRMYPKAYRFVGEMEEIARFLGDAGAAQMFLGAAGAYEEVAAAWSEAGADAPLLRGLGAVFDAQRAKERAA
jgi:3-hydroxyisobutyrate dehydrogenase-like beta-hydroxyacid dehydrogenase